MRYQSQVWQVSTLRSRCMGWDGNREQEDNLSLHILLHNTETFAPPKLQRMPVSSSHPIIWIIALSNEPIYLSVMILRTQWRLSQIVSAPVFAWLGSPGWHLTRITLCFSGFFQGTSTIHSPSLSLLSCSAYIPRHLFLKTNK